MVGDNDLCLHEFRFIPAKEPGVQAQLDESSSALKWFFELFDEKVQTDLVKLINEFATYIIQQNNLRRRRSKYSKWYPITRYELLRLFAVLIAMGIERRPNLCDYWSINSFNYTPWNHELFPRDRFEMLYSTMLHVNSIGDEKSKKYKIEPFLNKLLQNFQRAYYPDKDLSLDEMVVKWKGRSKFKIYNPSKPEKYHIKTFGLCDSHTGYAYNLLIYFGKETSYQEDVPGGQSEKIFQYLLRPLGSGHHVFANTNYTTHSLISYPSAKRIYYTGTLMSNRKNVPIEIKNPKIKHMESKFYRSREGILLCMWKNKIAKNQSLLYQRIQ